MALNMARILIAAGLVVANLYIGGLWCFVLLRARFSFAWFFALANAAAFLTSIINVPMVVDLPALYRALGRDAYYLVSWFLFSLECLVLLLNIIGATILVRFLLRYGSPSPGKA
jgi:hypothetical protein